MFPITITIIFTLYLSKNVVAPVMFSYFLSGLGKIQSVYSMTFEGDQHDALVLECLPVYHSYLMETRKLKFNSIYRLAMSNDNVEHI